MSRPPSENMASSNREDSSDQDRAPTSSDLTSLTSSDETSGREQAVGIATDLPLPQDQTSQEAPYTDPQLPRQGLVLPAAHTHANILQELRDHLAQYGSDGLFPYDPLDHLGGVSGLLGDGRVEELEARTGGPTALMHRRAAFEYDPYYSTQFRGWMSRTESSKLRADPAAEYHARRLVHELDHVQRTSLLWHFSKAFPELTDVDGPFDDSEDQMTEDERERLTAGAAALVHVRQLAESTTFTKEHFHMIYDKFVKVIGASRSDSDASSSPSHSAPLEPGWLPAAPTPPQQASSDQPQTAPIGLGISHDAHITSPSPPLPHQGVDLTDDRANVGDQTNTNRGGNERNNDFGPSWLSWATEQNRTDTASRGSGRPSSVHSDEAGRPDEATSQPCDIAEWRADVRTGGMRPAKRGQGCVFHAKKDSDESVLGFYQA